jgi:hypothetical chaperone protein
MPFCAIDFGTSNSAIAIPSAQAPTAAMQLIELEPSYRTMPTAVFYHDDEEAHANGLPPRVEFGRAAVHAYVSGEEGRLMRSMKSILGSTLAQQSTDVGGGLSVKYLDIITGYLSHLKRKAEAQANLGVKKAVVFNQAVIGRPVFFVDGEPARDRAAQAALLSCAQAAGFKAVAFQFEPIAAALDYERQVTSEQRVLVADIGGGTSDFSVVRVGPERMQHIDRKQDILANHGVHIAGTDFDRHIELATILREFGYKSHGPARGGLPGREVPNSVYFDLATWHLINTVYPAARVAELRSMGDFYANPLHHSRLMKVVNDHLGHALVAQAEAAKIAVSSGGDTSVSLEAVEDGLHLAVTEQQAIGAIDADLYKIVEAAHEAVSMAGLQADQIDALYFTGGSTGLRLLTQRLHAGFPNARAVQGEAFASVATGLGVYAQRLFG